MIRHVVMFKYQEEAEGNDKKYNLNKTKELLEKLQGKVEEIKYLHVGLNDDEADNSNYDLVLTVDVESISDLNAYQINPDHALVGKFIKKVAMARACVDYRV
ncbi:Dabb family protein [Vallitalea guaymasensis]|uniref:Dabb family protein n=1 Tax=Vallitalea guaymasensis TaxID=1185412 RepID=A0A8J8SBX2_9FIRM|nr:Dabb family protein [Vallitalea guaymasensis]QUH28840.1 Dabb family protein [Vallitalea guaymasensis]